MFNRSGVSIAQVGPSKGVSVLHTPSAQYVSFYLLLLTTEILSQTVGVLTFHRAEYLQALASRLDPAIATSHFSKRLVSYTQRTSITDSVALHFNDGTTATCDVLIGADGIHSATRHCLLKEAANAIATSDAEQAELLLGKVDPMWSGSIAYRAVFASEKLRCINPEHHVLNERQSVSLMSISLSITYGLMLINL